MMRTVLALSIAFGFSAVHAAVVPFTEDFAHDSANWRDAVGLSDLGWQATGGPDGGSYAFGTFNFVHSNENDTPAILRAQDEWNSSNNAFVGDWLADGVTQFSMMVRHDAPVPLTFFTRFASPANFPGAAGVAFVPVMPNTWTQVSFDIDPNNPAIVTEGVPFQDVFSNIGHVQIGVMVPADLAGLDQVFTFDVDKVSIVPEPATLALLALGAMTLRRRS